MPSATLGRERKIEHGDELRGFGSPGKARQMAGRKSRRRVGRVTMWDFEHSVEAPVSRERVWTLWTDIDRWPSWNPGVVRAELDGSFAEGATGSVRAAGGPASKLRVLTVEAERGFVTEASERLMRLRFEHELGDSEDGQLRITQRVQMTGLATPLMRRTVGPRLERSIPVALANLVELAKGQPAG